MNRDLDLSASDQANCDLIYMPMDELTAREIADEWKYPAPYEFYDMTADPEDYKEFVSSEMWPDFFLQVRRGSQLFGFLSGCVTEGNDCVEIGLGLRPDLTGCGLGHFFMRCNLEWIQRKYPGMWICLSVASFNQRAIKVYKASGFKVVRRFTQVTNGGEYDFVKMKYVP